MAEQYYVVEVYELHASRMRVRAASEAEAIVMVNNGGGREVGDPDYIETAENYGMPVGELAQETYDELKKQRLIVDDDFVRGIRSVEVDEDQDRPLACSNCGFNGASIEFAPSDGTYPDKVSHVCPECGSLDVFPIDEDEE